MENESEVMKAIGTSAEIALATAADAARSFIEQAKAPNTVRAYRADWNDFDAWCASRGLNALPATAETVILYVSELAGRCKVATLTRRISAISQAHQMAGHEPPTSAAAVRTVMAGIRRAKGTAPEPKAAAITDDIRGMVAALPHGLLGVRDRALLLVGFAGAFRRSELVGLERRDFDFGKDGLTVTLRRSKTDQEGQGRVIGIPYGSSPQTCPVRAIQAWLEASAIDEGPVFRGITRHGRVQPCRLSGYAVALVVKRYAAAAGLDPARYAGHSLRAGLATAAAIGGASERSIMAQTGHKSVNMVRRYIRDGNLFRENAAAKVGL
jgi:integrase